eukprot:scaffold655_cov105-Isochrysis_galbana.AAC.5
MRRAPARRGGGGGGYFGASFIWLHLGERTKQEQEVAPMNGCDADRTDGHHVGLTNLEGDGRRGSLVG